MASMLRQIGAVTAMNLRTVPQRLGLSLVVVAGIAGVVGVLVAMLAMATGFEKTLASTGRYDRVIVMRVGSVDELSSSLGVETARLIADLPGVRRGADGAPVAVPEVYQLTNISKKGDPTRAPTNAVVRGTAPGVFAVRPEAKIVDGRMFEPGKREVVVGRAARSEYADLEIGQTVEVRDGAWTIVGVFESGGDVHESELWVDAVALQEAMRGTFYSTVTAQLADDTPETFKAFQDHITQDPRLRVAPQREPDYYASRSEALRTFIKVIGYTVAVIMAIGAMFGALNTMYAAVTARGSELSTLRAIGFSGDAVIASIVVEALLLALAGAVIGSVTAYVGFNGFQVSGLNFQTFSQVAFAFTVTWELIVQGTIWALLIGLLGAVAPAATYAGSFTYRSTVLALGVGAVLSVVAGLLAYKISGMPDVRLPVAAPIFVGAVFAGTVALCLLASAAGWWVVRGIVQRRLDGGLRGIPLRLLLSLVFVLLGPVLVFWVVSANVLRALWGDPLELSRDPVLDGLRAA
jgi:putative ABC transport system permease protein